MYRQPPEEIVTMKRRFEQKIIDLLSEFLKIDSNLDFYERFIHYLKTGQEPQAVRILVLAGKPNSTFQLVHAEQLTRAWNHSVIKDFVLKPFIVAEKPSENQSSFNISQIDEKQLAQQLTLQDQMVRTLVSPSHPLPQYYHLIPLEEYQRTNWTKKEGKVLSPQLVAFIHRHAIFIAQTPN